ncbi:DUF4312 family protein [Erwinia psidii]|uniref:DUF4312 family protein n=1 Tax=Erwinia psidii TaxID=69224 RepID=A0A3N6UZ81_9GAMM|nr:DUF4312 family protein [Erwinia psidii]MCX8958240.1 DUF4312 family protein [Erwinia psidii]MCX8962382.1 DUF4312 family protein [Erwinia psidii]MCX8965166.1 DUF4312 family protein [Erwinia psidii]RQM38115.1 DUF4312 family protein [Erwinia psidii]
MKAQFTTTVNVSGTGDSKARAFADALSRVQKTLLQSTSKVLLRIEPQDVRVVQARESIRRETFLFFFLARTRRCFSVELEITVNVSVIDVDKVDFVTQ